MKTSIRILHLEDNLHDAEIVESTLSSEHIKCSITRVETQDDFITALEQGGIDLVIADFVLPGFSGLAAMEIVRAKWPDLPLILVSGVLGEEQAIDAVKGGATDYVLKIRLSRLGQAVRRAMREIEERERRLQAEHSASRERYVFEASLNTLPGIFYLLDSSLKFLRWNNNLERVSGYSSEEIFRMSLVDLFSAEKRESVAGKIQEAFTSGSSSVEAYLTAKNGMLTPYYFNAQRIEVDGKVCLVGVGVDISERHRLEAQFVEAQKMETIGHLAGGVAHDFNNILAVIIGYGDLLMHELKKDIHLHKIAEEIQQAAQRAAALTRQLLVFSRKQKVQPVDLDLNRTVIDMDKMLRRLVDENVHLILALGKETRGIRADAGHVGQVLMNLVVNARDAMPNGGRLTVKTHNVTVDEKNILSHENIPPGAYVVLSVSDTGIGMTDKVKQHLFEPFFTTKPKGKGTGLGLATCQTIAKQSNGYINVHSELGKGTTFDIYFPEVILPVNLAVKPKKTELPRGTETLLVVEDEPTLRQLACTILESQGYQVLRANNGQDGLHVACEHQGAPISLVVTDVVMPEMGGKGMVDWLKTTYPDLKVLFTSGYTDDAIAHHGVLEPGIAFLPKPYNSETLSRTVRAILDSNETS